MPVDSHIKQMMQDLGHALVEAIASSPEVGNAVRRIRQEGFSLFLVLERKDESERGPRIELTTRQPTPKDPAFLLDKGDVSLLKSIGIDATRSGRRRRTP